MRHFSRPFATPNVPSSKDEAASTIQTDGAVEFRAQCLERASFRWATNYSRNNVCYFNPSSPPPALTGPDVTAAEVRGAGEEVAGGKVAKNAEAGEGVQALAAAPSAGASGEAGARAAAAK